MRFILDSVIGLKWYEKLLWVVSVTGISICFFVTGNTDYITLVASLIGVSGLIFVAKGNVSVRDITENCGYSTATFYRQFKDKYDLIVWDHTRQVATVMNQIGNNGYPWKQTLLDGAKGFQKDKEYLANLLRHTKGQDSFIRNKTEINYNALKEQVLQSGKISELDEKNDMYIRLYCQGTVALTNYRELQILCPLGLPTARTITSPKVRKLSTA